MIIIYNNREEYNNADRINNLNADVIAVANENEYDIVKSRYTRQAAGVRFSYLTEVIEHYNKTNILKAAL
jgi:hypothetical protein